MKYVSEGLRALFLLNGAATISILTFIGNTKSSSSYMVNAMVCFAIGAATSPLTFFLAYLTELKYGNAARKNSNWNDAIKYHYASYVLVVLGVLSFGLGIYFAANGLSSIRLNPS